MATPTAQEDKTLAATQFLARRGLHSTPLSESAVTRFAAILSNYPPDVWDFVLDLFVLDLDDGGDGRRWLAITGAINEYEKGKGSWSRQQRCSEDLRALEAQEVAPSPFIVVMAGLRSTTEDKSMRWIATVTLAMLVSVPLGAVIDTAAVFRLGLIVDLPFVSDLLSLAVSVFIVYVPLRTGRRIISTTRVPAVNPMLTPLLVLVATVMFFWFKFLVFTINNRFSGSSSSLHAFAVVTQRGAATEWLFSYPFVMFCAVLLFGTQIIRPSGAIADVLEDTLSEYWLYAAIAIVISLVVRVVVAALS